MKFIGNTAKVFLGLILLLFLIGLFSSDDASHLSTQNENQSRYSETWADYPKQEISMALAKGNARGCACYDHKHDKSYSEYLVRCGCDPSEYKYYTVWTNLNKIVGPYSSEAEAF